VKASGAVKLNKTEREIIKKAILAEGERIGERLLAISVQSNHVHVVIAAGV
jgi:REP element-mobilizing transposase RayT